MSVYRFTTKGIISNGVWALAILAVAAIAAAILRWPAPTAHSSEKSAHPVQRVSGPPLRLGLVPERDLFDQHRKYRIIAEYLSTHLGRPVELVTSQSYDQIVADFGNHDVDFAFLGSLVTVLTVDRFGTEVLVKPRQAEGSVYRGVIFVPENSPVHRVEDLQAASVAIVRTTTGGNLFLIYEMNRIGMFSTPDRVPRLVWVGTHDDVIQEVVAGRASAGAVKDLRLNDYELQHPEVRLRRLGVSAEVPENALVVRSDLPSELKTKLRDLLLGMEQDQNGRSVLQQFGAEAFVPARLEEYSAIYDMIEGLGDKWALVGINGPSPKRPPGISWSR